ncbi:ankyrin repeat and SOCS box protein 12-like [Gymnodraco acuticeps]|uniref:Ankyrin repeat and SOCS box protein 12-like n=1 Tax=Gymnodraco acuticeps TaxID=8218 RepID=A0A6P8V7R2_GYMAC|nr:ankyrin repeat and SOCS box protein 12-like [Gymnodraco acuticeps]XP_034081611.1 ankyrin repeat and SOCS box protein 12-like [Gymnodraco acuticeps]XP_034081613.1 ankyrin repeat and SOCS box protein 12-like [Gymnodraco acuticeps]XP_034081615.1 ankyrin repeat and SOCS box protein 12-like [Gymnodraco acuticeps]XP_034081616.1 ankyrin repeat and SOCS box protein 12-like [Gymnodraco acuticeps]
MLQLRTAEEESSRSEISLLRQAVLQNDARLLDEMLCQEVYKKVINCRGGWGVSGTPLHAAVSKGHLSCLQVLLGRGALVDCVDVKAQTPLFSAVRGKYLDCVLALLKAGANPNGNSSNNCSPVLTAAREGDVKILKELLDGGAEVNSRSKVLLWTSSARVSSGPLYLAAVYGHMECFRLLLLYGADPDYNCTDAKLLGSIKQPKTVLEMCLRHGCGVEFVQLLIDFGANVYLPTLIIEKSTKQNEAVELLLEERGNPKALSSQCRLAVRAHLKTMDRMHLIDQLDMPTRLVNFLKHKPVSVPVL